MKVRLFNNLTDKMEEFVPVRDNKVSMYVCGITTYNYPHIGNIRPVIVFDVLNRFLSYMGYKVEYTRNYTDIDDRIIKKAREENTTEAEISKRYIASYEDSIRKINALMPDHAPRVTGYINEIIAFVGELLDKDAAYVIDGDVYFRVSRIKDYGILSHVNLDELNVGARIEENVRKENPLDFALWKKTEEGIRYESPWGQGRPGWHTECVVMVNSIYKQKEIDIHGGGFDLKFPHHDNEIAQSIAYQNTYLSKYWLHNGFVNFKEEKMSKSLGNIILAKDAIDQYGGNAIRLWMLSTHYRLPISLSEESVKSSQKELSKIENALKLASVSLQVNHQGFVGDTKNLMDNFLAFLGEDLNTPNAITEVYSAVKEINKLLKEAPVDFALLKQYFIALTKMIGVLGLDIRYPVLTTEDHILYQKYLQAKNEKDFISSDRYRQELIAKNIL